MYSAANRYLVSSRINGFLEEELREYVHENSTDVSQVIRDLLERELSDWRERVHKGDSIHKDLADMVKRTANRKHARDILVDSDDYRFDPDGFTAQCEKYGFSLDEILSLQDVKNRKTNLSGITSCEYFVMGRLSLYGKELSSSLREACVNAGFTRSDIDRAFERRTSSTKDGDVWYKELKEHHKITSQGSMYTIPIVCESDVM